MFVRICLLGALLMGVLSGPAASQDSPTVKWGEVGVWQIYVDRTVNGCFTGRYFLDGTALRLGIDPRSNTVYLMLGNKAWQSIEAGKTYLTQFIFDDANKYDRELLAVPLGPFVVLEHSNVGADFMKDFVERTSLRVDYRGSPITHLSLHNANAALSEVAKCQSEVRPGGSTVDPGIRAASDPSSR
jgi:hypothetical protein